MDSSVDVQEVYRSVPIPMEAPEANGRGPRAAATAASAGVGPRRETRFVWKTSSYRGELTAETVDSLLRSDRAAELEDRLRPEPAARLRTTLSGIDAAMVLCGQHYQTVTDRVKEMLRQDPSRTIVLRSTPRVPKERDPDYPRVLAAERQLGKDGVVFGDIHGGQVIYYLVRFDEWPELKSCIDDQVRLVHERKTLVAKWITGEYRALGVGLFKP